MNQTKKPDIYIGTSGFRYIEWKEFVYPAEVKKIDWLNYYAKHFNTTEVNSSFYHLPQKATVEKWVDKVSNGFKFCPKITRFITHIKKLRDCKEPVAHYFGIFEPMKKMMVPVLIQLPASLLFHEDVTRQFFDVLKYHDEYDFAIEPRHASWMKEEALALITEYNIALVIAQSGVNFPYKELITTKDVYIRFHGPKQLYASSYSAAMMKEYAGKMAAWANDKHRIWAFFNNTANGFALENARLLKKLLHV